MTIEFYINDDIDMTKIADSMQLDSNQVIASMRIGDMEASIEVQGEVKIWWNEEGNPFDGEYYIYPSEFPEKLKELIAAGYTDDGLHWTLDPRLYISENNWFEVFYGTGTDVVDVEGYTPAQLFEMLYYCLKEVKAND